MSEPLFASRRHKEELCEIVLQILRKDPEHWGIAVDEWGFVHLEDLKLAVETASNWAKSEQVEAVISGNKSFELWQDKIRAKSGHQFPVRSEPEAVEPTAILYHGLPSLLVSSVTKFGLKPLSGRFVFLALTVDEAWYQGNKHTTSPITIAIMAGKAYQEGIKFYKSDRDYLCEYIPAEYISIRI
jgi:putative RNA 2'-phosphotransferase